MTTRDHLTVVTYQTIKPGDTLVYQHHSRINHRTMLGERPVYRATVERLTATQAVMDNGDRWMIADLPCVNIRGKYTGGDCAAVFDGPDADDRARAATRASHLLADLRWHMGHPRVDVITNPDALRTLVDQYWDAARTAWGEEAVQ